MIELAVVSAFADNYIYLGGNPATRECFVVDPGDGAPALAEAERRGWRVTSVLNTHWHGDHTGGNAAVRAATDAPVTGPAAEAAKIRALDHPVREGDRVTAAGFEARVLDIPGHTAGHIAFVFDELQIAFVGDTIFAAGCGRLLEGTADQMWHSLTKLMALPDSTLLACAHEYTLANLAFAEHVEPGSPAVAAAIADAKAARAQGVPTVPTTVAAERTVNPFVRAGSAAEFARRRAAKDAFRG
ncbi:MAG: hydroxyacylglutathione hydrolase [Sphingomonadaceae bacterium]|nr:hydroxyacylglutathione hydrolase [Sphingomonadaceae bacterium]